MADALNTSRTNKNFAFLSSLDSNPKPIVAAPAKPAPKYDNASYDNLDSPRPLLQDGETEF